MQLLLFGERAVRWLVGITLVAATIGLGAVAVLGPEALLAAPADGLPNMLVRLRLALADVFG